MSDYNSILRFFTPKELLKFHCFSKQFSFPPSLSIIQQYKLIGNSLNVQVVTFLLKILFDFL